jgi:hypothetical protein
VNNCVSCLDAGTSSDTCNNSGACRCGSGPPCAAPNRCVIGQCVP